MIIMGIMSGYWGYRGLGRFVERHRRSLIKILAIEKARVPSYSTLRRVMLDLDYQVLAEVFGAWASQSTNTMAGQWVAIDGKSLRNTVTDYDCAEQNFVSMVSAFSHTRGEVLGLKVMENKHESEIQVVENLLPLLGLQETVFSLDALHCQKKLSPPSKLVATIT
jgi:hypothetical protein